MKSWNMKSWRKIFNMHKIFLNISTIFNRCFDIQEKAQKEATWQSQGLNENCVIVVTEFVPEPL